MQACDERNALEQKLAQLQSQLPQDTHEPEAAGTSSSLQNTQSYAQQQILQLQRDLATKHEELQTATAEHAHALECAEQSERAAERLQEDLQQSQAAAERRALEADNVMKRLRSSIAAQETQLADGRSQAANDAAAAEAKLAAAESSMQQLQEKLRDAEQQLDAALADKAAATRLVEDVRTELDTAVADKAAATRHLEDAHAEALRTNEELSQVQHELTQTRAGARKAERQLQLLQAELATKDCESQQLKSSSGDQEHELMRLSEQLNAAYAAEAELTMQLEAAQQQLETSQSAAGGDAKRCQELAATVGTLQTQLDSTRQNLADVQVALEHSNERCNALSAAAHAAEVKQRDAEEQVAELQQARQQSQRQLVSLQTEIHGMHQQLSQGQYAERDAQAMRDENAEFTDRLEAADQALMEQTARAVAAEEALAAHSAAADATVTAEASEVEEVAQALQNVQGQVQASLHQLGAADASDGVASDDTNIDSWQQLSATAKAVMAGVDSLCAAAQSAQAALAAARISHRLSSDTPRSLQGALTTPRLPLSQPAPEQVLASPSTATAVSVDMAPLMGRRISGASGRHAPHIVQRREPVDALAAHTSTGVYAAGAGCLSPHASSGASQSDEELIAWRRIDTVTFVRQLSPRLQGALVTVDEGCHVVAKCLLAVPAGRLGMTAWLLVVHLWFLASLQHHYGRAHV